MLAVKTLPLGGAEGKQLVLEDGTAGGEAEGVLVEELEGCPWELLGDTLVGLAPVVDVVRRVRGVEEDGDAGPLTLLPPLTVRLRNAHPRQRGNYRSATGAYRCAG